MILLGVDVGGTFTDLILANLADNTIAIHKVPSTAPDPSIGVLEGIHHLCEQQGVPVASICDSHPARTALALREKAGRRPRVQREPAARPRRRLCRSHPNLPFRRAVHVD